MKAARRLLLLLVTPLAALGFAAAQSTRSQRARSAVSADPAALGRYAVALAQELQPRSCYDTGKRARPRVRSCAT